MYCLVVHGSDRNTAVTDSSGQTAESGSTAADKVTGQVEGRAAIASAMCCAVTCSMGTAVDEEEEEEEGEEGEAETGDDGGVTSGREVQLQV
jgi:hypothetical protein